MIDFAFSGDSSTLAFSRLSSLEENATTNVYSTQETSTPPVKIEDIDYALSVDFEEMDEDDSDVTFTVTASDIG